MYTRKEDEYDDVLNMTPISVKTINWEMIKNAKYLARTARSSLELVETPMYFDSHLMMIGKTNPKRAETTDGKTPEMTLKDLGEAVCHSSRKVT